MVDQRGPDECWPWKGSINKKGYGRFYDGERYRSAALFGFESLIGPMPEGKELNHSCNNHACQNPAHWMADTHAVNMAEMRSRHGYIPLLKARAFTEEQVTEIKRRYAMGECTQVSMAKEYGVNRKTIAAALRR